MSPQLHNQLLINLSQTGADQIYDVPKGSSWVNRVMITYLLPVLSYPGLRSPCFRKAKASSTGAVEYEYGADMITRRPSAFMWFTDSLQV